MTPLLVLHDFGCADGGGPWASAFNGWDGPVHAPDLPGHGSAPPPIDGNYEHADSAWVGVRAGVPRESVVVGIGDSGWGAHLLALGGRASALVLVDGLGGPWLDAGEWVENQRAWIRGVADDPAAAGSFAGPGQDPRIRHGVLPTGSLALAERSFAALGVPLLVIQTPAAPSRPSDVPLPASTVVVDAADRSPAVIAPIVTDWFGRYVDR